MTTNQSPADKLRNHTLEKAVLTSVMVNSNDFDVAHRILAPDCFDHASYREIFEAMCSIYNNGRLPDLLSITYELSARNSRISSLDVFQLLENSMQVIDIEQHSLKLRELSNRRKLYSIGVMISSKACNEGIEIESIQTEACERLDSLFGAIDQESVTVEDVYKKLQERMILNRDPEAVKTLGTPTGFDFIDRGGGLIPSELIVVGAESSKGKTSFATALTLKAIEHGHPVAFYSMEMQPEDITARIASMKTGYSVSRILHQCMEWNEIYAVDAAMEEIRKNALFYDSRTVVSLDSMLSSIRRMKKRHGIRGVVVDYLQLIDIRAAGCTREQATAECARKLKNLAMELNIWIIAISQLNRANDGDVPSMGRLRGSGQIAEAANNIYLIHRTETRYPAPFEDTPVNGTAMVIVAKGRNVGTGSFIAGFKPETTLFYPITPIEIADLREEACNGGSTPSDSTLQSDGLTRRLDSIRY